MKLHGTAYNNDGELLAPRPGVLNVSISPGGKPTMEPGFYHRFKFEGHRKEELAHKTRMFFDLMASAPGYSTLSLRNYVIRGGARHGLDIIYVIEEPAIGVR